MKHKFIYFTLLSVSLLITSACKKSTLGFLSPYIHYEVDPILIPKGRNFLSAGLNGDGTSQPYTCKVLHFYNKATGQNVDTMFAHTYPVQIWTALYSPKTRSCYKPRKRANNRQLWCIKHPWRRVPVRSANNK